jgi:penicillin-binding protein 2
MALAGLLNGLNPKDQIFSPGYLDVPNPYNSQKPTRFLDWQYQGWVDMYSAIAKSSDVYFYVIGGGYGNKKGLGISRIKEWWMKFLLDKKTNIDLIGENNGFLPDPEWKEKEKKSIWRIGDTYNVSIGQGDLLVTPISLLNYVAAISNGGVIYKPRVVKNIVDEDNKVVFENKVEILADLRQEIGPYIKEIQKAMIDVVSKPYGTAHLLNDLPFQVAGKTGSAQYDRNTKLNAFFVGYAPANDPEIAILILIEDAKEGSLNTIPIARDVFLWYYENRYLPKRGNF